ncbi:17342_t:CDS:2 [Acaulospora colombiana]|uniref:17342_t:CDS:1 n=1 Tax=Acaulospora colombiana TaxID=27376 RepID=A0ACA9NCD6_9GLOM|nr:17342_t:CDS:2 [Acaulospora colombiana]
MHTALCERLARRYEGTGNTGDILERYFGDVGVLAISIRIRRRRADGQAGQVPDVSR